MTHRTSVPDPDPPRSEIICPQGSGSGSQIINFGSESGSGSLRPHDYRAKRVRTTVYRCIFSIRIQNWQCSEYGSGYETLVARQLTSSYWKTVGSSSKALDMTILVCFFSAADPVAVFFIDFFTQSSPPAKMRGNDDI